MRTINHHFNMLILLCFLGLKLLIVTACEEEKDQNESDNKTTFKGKYLGQIPPDYTPVRFVPDFLLSNQNWWWHGRIDFQNDGNELFMDIYCPAENGIRIRHMKIVDEYWTYPAASPFSSDNIDASPSFINNGNKVFFLSDRPNSVGYGIWNAEKNNGVWSTPQPVEVPVNSSIEKGWEISVTDNETIYFRMKVIGGLNREDIFVINKVNGQYTTPERLDDNINSPYSELGVFVDPEEEYMLFSSDRPDGFGEHDIYISYRNLDGTWGQAVNLGGGINSSSLDIAPSVSPDKKYLFFKSYRQGNGNPFWVDAQIIVELKPTE